MLRPRFPSIVFLNSFFLNATKMPKKAWKSLKNMDSITHLLIPVNYSRHWFFLIVDLINYQIFVFDSLMGKTNPRIQAALDAYLKDVLKIKTTFKWISMEVIIQEDSINCGVWTLINAQRFLLNQSLLKNVDMVAAREKLAVDLVAPLLESKEEGNYIIDCKCNYKCNHDDLM